jgi:endonuclease/exonuclease/phosphatase (EEP) superfamily protein YafD
VTVTEDDEDDGEPSRLWPALVGGLLVLSIALVMLGFLGWLHPVADSIAVGRGFAVGAVLLLSIPAVLLGMRVPAFWAILFALLAGTPVVLAQLWPGPTGQLTLYQKNLKYRNTDLAGLEADIRAVAPMALTLQEVSVPNMALLDSLKDLLPHQQVCGEVGAGGPAVATSLPPVEGARLCAPGLAAMQVIWKDSQGEAPVWLVSLHLHWPWPYAQADHAEALASVLAGLEGSVLMAGDFNMVRWGDSVQTLARAARTQPAGPSRGTFLGFEPAIRLAIDHAFGPVGGRLELRPALGSDHLGLLAYLEP